ncbi:unnamed protein product, partial [Ixodes pacificus]
MTQQKDLVPFGCLSILEHVAEPSLVANCSAAVLRCRLDTSGPNLEVWWTFHGENASKLPNVVLVPPPSRNATSTTPAPPSSSSPVTSTAGAILDDVTTVSDDVGDNAAATTTVSPAAVSTTVSSPGGSESADEEAADDESVWTLRLNCPTLEHAGSYACYALSRNASEFIYKKEASLDVYDNLRKIGRRLGEAVRERPGFRQKNDVDLFPRRRNAVRGLVDEAEKVVA